MEKDSKYLKVSNIQEGMVKKGGIEKCPPSMPRPAPPKGHLPASTFLNATKVISNFCAQFKYCLKCPLDMSTSTLPGGMASPNRCLLLDPPANWNHDLIKDRLEK